MLCERTVSLSSMVMKWPGKLSLPAHRNFECIESCEQKLLQTGFAREHVRFSLCWNKMWVYRLSGGLNRM